MTSVPEDLESDLRRDESPDGDFLHPTESPPTPERELAAKQVLEQIEDAFRDDPEALAILEGIAIGSSPEEVQTKTAMSAVKYASAQRRIRRMLTRIF